MKGVDFIIERSDVDAPLGVDGGGRLRDVIALKFPPFFGQVVKPKFC